RPGGECAVQHQIWYPGGYQGEGISAPRMRAEMGSPWSVSQKRHAERERLQSDMRRSMIQGVLFDMDGLMFDTERMWGTFWAPALAEFGLSYKEGLAEAARRTAGETLRGGLRS